MFDLLNFNRNYIYNFTTPSNLGALTRDLGEIRNYHKVIMTAAKLIQMYLRSFTLSEAFIIKDKGHLS